MLNGTDYVAVAPTDTSRGGALHPSLPTRPAFDIVPKDEYKPPAKAVKLNKGQMEVAALKVGDHFEGTNEELIENRRKHRLANIDAAARLKAELAGVEYVPEVREEKEEKEEEVVVAEEEAEDEPVVATEGETVEVDGPRGVKRAHDDTEEGDEEEGDDDGDAENADESEEDGAKVGIEEPKKKKLKFNPDGTVDGYEDTVK